MTSPATPLLWLAILHKLQMPFSYCSSTAACCPPQAMDARLQPDLLLFCWSYKHLPLARLAVPQQLLLRLPLCCCLPKSLSCRGTFSCYSFAADCCPPRAADGRLLLAPTVAQISCLLLLLLFDGLVPLEVAAAIELRTNICLPSIPCCYCFCFHTPMVSLAAAFVQFLGYFVDTTLVLYFCTSIAFVATTFV